jgi:hypothetical protein
VSAAPQELTGCALSRLTSVVPRRIPWSLVTALRGYPVTETASRSAQTVGTTLQRAPAKLRLAGDGAIAGARDFGWGQRIVAAKTRELLRRR